MSSYPPPGECVHCGGSHRALTWDHVFPKSWYPASTPQNIEKWQIPSCKRCNAEYGKLEEELLIKIGLCIDPDDFKSLGISEKVLRALNPRFGKNAKDRRGREAKRSKILRESLSINKLPQEGLYPNFDKFTGVWTGLPIGVLISNRHIEKLTEKIVKGITYLEDGHIVRDPYRISSYVLQDRDAAPIVSLLARSGSMYAREPGIEVLRGTAIDDPKTAIYAITIWGRFKMYAYIGMGDGPQLDSDVPRRE